MSTRLLHHDAALHARFDAAPTITTPGHLEVRPVEIGRRGRHLLICRDPRSGSLSVAYTINGYDAEAITIAAGLHIRVDINLLGHFPYRPDDDASRNVYQFALTNERTGATYSARFGDSIKNTTDGIRPWVRLPRGHMPGYMPVDTYYYNILACLTKCDPGTFAEFCADYGYGTDPRTAQRMYFEVQEEYAGLLRVAGSQDALDQLAEIV